MSDYDNQLNIHFQDPNNEQNQINNNGLSINENVEYSDSNNIYEVQAPPPQLNNDIQPQPDNNNTDITVQPYPNEISKPCNQSESPTIIDKIPPPCINNQNQNITNNPNKISIPEPYNNNQGSEPIVAPEYNNIQQPINIAQYSNSNYKAIQPFRNIQYVNYQNNNQQYNDVKEQDTCDKICKVCIWICGISCCCICIFIIISFILFVNFLNKIFDSLR